MLTPKNYYPRPQLQREKWENLNGIWEFSFDEPLFDRKIQVPFVYQSKQSGVHVKAFHHTVWYRRKVVLSELPELDEVLIHFEGVDYQCSLWINDIYIREHTGGQTGFSANITKALQKGENTICLKVTDEGQVFDIPRGKQYWKEKSESIFYTPMTGIWQTVWMEQLHPIHLKAVFMTPNLDEKSIAIEYDLQEGSDTVLRVEIFFEGTPVCKEDIYQPGAKGGRTIFLSQQKLLKWNFQEDLTWSPDSPRLFDVVFTVLERGVMVDRVKSYFGMRKISIENGKIMLNNRVFFQKLILDQGYWEDSLYTAPDEEALVRDIQFVKEMGFHGVRKHQKVEEARFLYHADRMGLLVWEEIGSAYVYSRSYAQAMMQEWASAVLRDYNHPCIVTWVPLNESWGIPEVKTEAMQQAHSLAMVYLTKSLDATRPVISNDGWEHTASDIITIHDYEKEGNKLQKTYETIESVQANLPAKRPLFADGFGYSGQPVFVSEFGGVAFGETDADGWGYSNAASKEDFLEGLHKSMGALENSPLVQGFCYTQLTDVEQESNGLLTVQRKPKADLEQIRSFLTK